MTISQAPRVSAPETEMRQKQKKSAGSNSVIATNIEENNQLREKIQTLTRSLDRKKKETLSLSNEIRVLKTTHNQVVTDLNTRLNDKSHTLERT